MTPEHEFLVPKSMSREECMDALTRIPQDQWQLRAELLNRIKEIDARKKPEER